VLIDRTAQTTTSSLTSYSYDFENRLETANPGVPVSYGYDPFGKRLAKTVGGATTYYLYDEEDVIAEYDATGALIASYVHGPGIDEPISMTRGGSTYYYTFDGLGSVRDLTDAAQSIVEQYDYDSFGNLTAPPTTGNPYTYTSREYDPETGLLFYRARYYDPKVGRFLKQDPKGFDGGDVNFYAYTFNNPINFTDPFGLQKKRVFEKFERFSFPNQLPGVLISEVGAVIFFIPLPQAKLAGGGLIILGGVLTISDFLAIPDAVESVKDEVEEDIKDQREALDEILEELDNTCPVNN
jgi:RHS repeat-associated protein